MEEERRTGQGQTEAFKDESGSVERCKAGDRHQITSVIDLLSSPKPSRSKLVRNTFRAANIIRHGRVNGVIASW